MNLIKQELSDVNTNKSGKRSCSDETCHRNELDQKKHCLKAIAPFCYKNCTRIIEKLLYNILHNSEKVKTVKHISENQKQKVQRKTTRKIT